MKVFFNMQATNTPFERKGDDLVYTHCLSLEDALISKPFQIRTLDDRYININLDQMITPQTTHFIKGEGMPKKASNKEKGDLTIKFSIQFPLNFKQEYKNQIIEILAK